MPSAEACNNNSIITMYGIRHNTYCAFMAAMVTWFFISWQLNTVKFEVYVTLYDYTPGVLAIFKQAYFYTGTTLTFSN